MDITTERVSSNGVMTATTAGEGLAAQYTPAQFQGPRRRLKISLTTQLNRHDFGLVWNSPVLKVADTLNVRIALEATPA